ncbi:MAG: hypothetical protein SNJ82_14745, partial [Gemmataceae bacterium]
MNQRMMVGALILVLGSLTTTQGQKASPGLSGESAELLFLMYALEEKTRDVLSLTDELRDSLEQPVPPLRLTTPLRKRTARTRVHVDALRRHVSEKKLPSELRNYCERLLTHLDHMDGKLSLATRLERIENKYESKILSLWNGFLQDEEQKAIQRVGASLQAGLFSFAESTRRLETSPLDNLLSGAIDAFGQQMAQELVDLPRRQAAFAKVNRQAEELRKAIRPMLMRELTEELSRFEAGPSRSKLETDWAQLLRAICKRQDWPAAWLSPNLGVARPRFGRPHDPFVPLDEAREWLYRPIKSSE